MLDRPAATLASLVPSQVRWPCGFFLVLRFCFGSGGFLKTLNDDMLG
jgi:hypothetical protein